MITRMDLEGITLSNISQTEKDKYCMISLVCVVYFSRHNLKAGVILFGGSVQNSEVGRQNLSSSEKTAPKRQGRNQAIYKFPTKGAGSLNIKDQVSSYFPMYGKMQVSGLTEFIPLIYTSAIWGHSCFLIHLASCIPPAPQLSPWGVAASAGSQFWKPSFTFGGQKSLMAVTCPVY